MPNSITVAAFVVGLVLVIAAFIAIVLLWR